jgi:hypothetical protein
MSNLIIKQLSDLHLEFGVDYIPDCSNIDVLVLAGDIGVGWEGISWALTILDKYRELEIIYVCGNHEFYHNIFDDLVGEIKFGIEDSKRLHFLNNDSVIIKGVRFIGATLWSSLKNSFEAIRTAAMCMNDYYHIHMSTGRVLSPQDTIGEHDHSVKYIFKELKKSKEKCVVVTHHKPYIDEPVKDMLGYAYATDLKNEFNECLNLPIVWFYGHTHIQDDKTISYKNGDVRFVANPKGYKHQPNKEYNENLKIEIQN